VDTLIKSIVSVVAQITGLFALGKGEPDLKMIAIFKRTFKVDFFHNLAIL
jgi:hypothetical protein